MRRPRHLHDLQPVALSYPSSSTGTTSILFQCSQRCRTPDAWFSVTLGGTWAWADLNGAQLLAPDIAAATETTAAPAMVPPEPDFEEPHYVLASHAEEVMAQYAGEEPGYTIVTTDEPYRCWVLGYDHEWREHKAS